MKEGKTAVPKAGEDRRRDREAPAALKANRKIADCPCRTAFGRGWRQLAPISPDWRNTLLDCAIYVSGAKIYLKA